MRLSLALTASAALLAAGCSRPLVLALSSDAVQSASNYNLCRAVLSNF